MPTKKPRLMLSVSRELLHDLETLALASRKPVATVATELLQDTRPQMLAIAREIAGITLDRKRAQAIDARIQQSAEGQQHGFRFTERVKVTGISLSGASSQKQQGESPGAEPSTRRNASGMKRSHAKRRKARTPK